MSQRTKALTFALSVVMLAGIAACGLWMLQETKPAVCPICARSIHEHSSAVVVIDNKRVTVCCIRCGITNNFRVGKPGEVAEVTDYDANSPLSPRDSFYVEGSRVSMCDPHDSGLIDQTKHPYPRIFDRCEPSTYAFSKQEDAAKFVRTNGGKILNWEELKKEAGAQP
jgi:hypothetical protein